MRRDIAASLFVPMRAVVLARRCRASAGTARSTCRVAMRPRVGGTNLPQTEAAGALIGPRRPGPALQRWWEWTARSTFTAIVTAACRRLPARPRLPAQSVPSVRIKC